jgi:hypothetical protein
MINHTNKYCSWFVRPATSKGRAPLTLFQNSRDIAKWIRRTDTENARIHGITKQTAMNVTKTLIPGGRRALQAHVAVAKALGISY